MSRREWTREERAKLKQMWEDPERTREDVADALTRTVDSVAYQAKALRLGPKAIAEPVKIERLEPKAIRPGETRTQAIARWLAYSTHSAGNIARKFGVSESVVSRINAERKIRPPKNVDHEGMVTAATLAEEDLREQMRLYDCPEERVKILRGYAVAAEKLIQVEQEAMYEPLRPAGEAAGRVLQSVEARR